jgi:hypothetical protein
MQYFALPAVSNEGGTAHDGTSTLPTTPFETFVFGRRVPHQQRPPLHGETALAESHAR